MSFFSARNLLIFFATVGFLLGLNFFISYQIFKEKSEARLNSLVRENTDFSAQILTLKHALRDSQSARKKLQIDYISHLESSKHGSETHVVGAKPACPVVHEITPDAHDDQEEYWHNFGRDDHYKMCDGDFGWDLIKKWRNLKELYSTPVTDSVPPTIGHCHKIQQTRHSATDTFCHFENLYYFPGRVIGGNAKMKSDSYQLELGGSMNSWRSVQTQCSETLPGVTLLVNRDDAFNVFHSLANILNAFQSMLILNMKPRVDRIVFLDSLPEGPYYSIWNAFTDKIEKLDREVCFQRAVYTIPGGSSFIWKDVWKPNYCYHSSILKSFARFILNHYGLLEQVRKKPGDPIRITFSSRKIKPNAAPSRRIFNEGILKTILETKLKSTTGKPIPVKVTLIDLASISFKEQISLMRNTDIYLGAHGAGMTHLIYLPDEAVVVELFPKGWHQSSMRNLAKYTGKTYLSWQNLHDENVREGNNAVVDEAEFLSFMNHAANIVLSFHIGTGMI